MSDREVTSAEGRSPGDAADALKRRLRDDLMTAMRARSMGEVGVLRTLIAVLDNAQAVPVSSGHQRYVERPFGDPSVEVPRLQLDSAAVHALLSGEAAQRNAAAAQFENLGKPEHAARLRSEADIIARYLDV